MAVMLRKNLAPLRYSATVPVRNRKPDPQTNASDSEWRRVLSLGEDQVKTTPRQLSAFMLAIGQGGGKLLSAATAERLNSGP